MTDCKHEAVEWHQTESVYYLATIDETGSVDVNWRVRRSRTITKRLICSNCYTEIDYETFV